MATDGPSPFTDGPDGGPSLREAALSGVRWIAVGKLLTELAAFGGAIVLARLVAPAEFGAVAPAAFIIAVGGSLAYGSFGTPLVRATKMSRELVSTALALSLLTGAAVSALIIAATEVIDVGYSAHSVHLIQVVAPSFLIFSAGCVSQALLERDLDFRRSAMNDVGALIPGTVVTVVLAALGLGGLALALGYLAMTAFQTAQALWFRPPPPPRLHRRHVREILTFGIPTSASSVLYTMQRTIGLGILGARLDPVSTGYFWRAQQLGIEYQSKVTSVLLRMLFPLLARTASREQMRMVRMRMVQTHTAFLFPILALLIVLAPTIVPWVFGQRWAGAAEPTQILAIVGLATVVNTGTGPVVLAHGHPRALLIKDAIELPALIAMLLLTASHGLITVCIGLATFRLVSLLANQYFLIERLCGIPLRDTLVRDVLPAATASALLAAAAWVVHAQLESLSLPVIVDLAISSAAGLLVYGATLRALFTRTWKDCAAVVARLQPRLSRANA
jgi:O-antigen/teichoic acid export membrane protein